MMKNATHRIWLAGLLLLLLALIVSGSAFGTKDYIGGTTRFVYRTEIGSDGVELTTTKIQPLGEGRFGVQTITEVATSSDNIRPAFLGGAFKWLGVYVSQDTSQLLDLSPLGALGDQVLEPHKTYLLPDGGKLQTGERVTIAGLSGVEGDYTHASFPGAVIGVVLADDLYLRQFLPYPLRVELEYEEDETIIGRSFRGMIELVEYVHVSDEEETS